MPGREEGSSKHRTTKIMAADERAAKAVVAGDERVLNRWHHGLEERSTKRKAEAAAVAAGDEKKRTNKRKTADLGCSELEQGSKAPAPAAVARKEEEAPARKMTRLPQEEIDYILGRVMDDSRAPRDYKALKRQNPGLIPSPEEETNQRLLGLYAGARVFYAIGERFSYFQAWIRSEYTKKGYVEVDDEFLANRAEMQALNEEARNEALAGFDFSEMDDDMKRVFLRF